MDRIEKSAEQYVWKKNNPVRDALFEALGQSCNAYLASKLTPQQSYQLAWFWQQIAQLFDSNEIVELPSEHHITRSFLWTKSADQLRSFHDKLLAYWPELQSISASFNKFWRFRSFVNGRIILFAKPDDETTQKLLSFWQTLRMHERNPKKWIDEFSPHITLAQLSPALSDDKIESIMDDKEYNIPTITPSFDSLWFQGKSSDEKVSMQIF